jgi:hypothetical protein
MHQFRNNLLRSLAIEPDHPQVSCSDDEIRVIAVRLPSGEEPHQHQVHERTYVLVADVAGGLSGGGKVGSQGRRQMAARSTARIRGWLSISSSSTTSTSSRPTIRPRHRRPSWVIPSTRSYRARTRRLAREPRSPGRRRPGASRRSRARARHRAPARPRAPAAARSDRSPGAGSRSTTQRRSARRARSRRARPCGGIPPASG